MEAVNSLLFLLTTLAPYTEPPENSPVTYSPPEWNKISFSRGEQDVPNYVDPDNFECPPDEEGSCFSHCEPNCTNFYLQIPCTAHCFLGCVCKLPKVRGPDGSCIFPQQCPIMQSYQSVSPDTMDIFKSATCPENEEYDECGTACPKNCTNYDKNIPCPSMCVSGCFCKDPMIRGPDGNCIYEEECPERLNSVGISDKHYLDSREWPESDHDDDDDDDDDNLNSLPGPLGQLNFCRGKNEVWSVCPPQCPDNCDNYKDKKRACKIICLPIPKCDCKKGFVRGPSGDCIKPEQCPRHEKQPEDCTDHEMYNTCGTPCEQNCTTYSMQDSSCPDKRCVVGCFCQPGYIRGPSGECILPFECWIRSPQSVDYDAKQTDDDHDTEEFETFFDDILNSADPDTFKSVTCPENEEYDECGTACPKNCTNYDKNIPCPSMCASGCFCKDPMIRGPDGKCIHKEECDERLTSVKNSQGNCPENEEYRVCGTACPKNCRTYDKDIPCEFKCQPGCFCKNPMIRGPDGKCIYKEQCPQRSIELRHTRLCPEHEEYLFCGSLCPENCTTYGKPEPCLDMCVRGCFCEKPRIRGPDGKCILPEECPSTLNGPEDAAFVRRLFPDFPNLTCKKNEEFSLCASICPDNCLNYEVNRLCKRICIPGCSCKEGYVIGEDGTCIKKEYCKEQTRDDCTELEYYDNCGTYCETDCYNYNIPDRECEDKRCRKGCFCKPGWVRSPDWKCVLPHRCPSRSMPQTYWSLRYQEKSIRA